MKLKGKDIMRSILLLFFILSSSCYSYSDANGLKKSFKIELSKLEETLKGSCSYYDDLYLKSLNDLKEKYMESGDFKSSTYLDDVLNNKPPGSNAPLLFLNLRKKYENALLKTQRKFTEGKKELESENINNIHRSIHFFTRSKNLSKARELNDYLISFSKDVKDREALEKLALKESSKKKKRGLFGFWKSSDGTYLVVKKKYSIRLRIVNNEVKNAVLARNYFSFSGFRLIWRDNRKDYFFTTTVKPVDSFVAKIPNAKVTLTRVIDSDTIKLLEIHCEDITSFLGQYKDDVGKFNRRINNSGTSFLYNYETKKGSRNVWYYSEGKVFIVSSLNGKKCKLYKDIDGKIIHLNQGGKDSKLKRY